MFALIVIVMLSGTLKKTTTKKTAHYSPCSPAGTLWALCCLEERTSLSLPGLHRRKWGEMLCAQGHVIPHRETHIYPVMLSVLVCAYARARTHTHTFSTDWVLAGCHRVWNFAMSTGLLPCPSWVLWRSQTCTYASTRIMLFSPADNIIKVIFDIMS